MTYSSPSGNTTSFTKFFSWLNSSVSDWFFPAMIIGVWFIIFIKLLNTSEGAGRAFGTASFVCMILSVLLRAIDLCNTTIMLVFIIFTAIGGVWIHFENESSPV